MKMLERFKNFFRLFSIKRDEAIYTCLQNNIPLTNENINKYCLILIHIFLLVMINQNEFCFINIFIFRDYNRIYKNLKCEKNHPEISRTF